MSIFALSIRHICEGRKFRAERNTDRRDCEQVEMAILNFRHSGWDETSEYFGFCNFGWEQVLQKLKQVCESQ